MTLKRLAFAGLAAAALCPSSGFSAPPPAIRESVTICNPNAPTQCAAPDASGNLPITGSISVTPPTNYSLETGGNLDRLVAAIGSPVPAASHCQATALAAQVTCGAAGAHTLVDFTVTADSTLNASAWYILIIDGTTLANGAVTPMKCYQVPSGQSQFGATFAAGGVNQTSGLIIGVSTTGCYSATLSTHALFIGASYL